MLPGNINTVLRTMHKTLNSSKIKAANFSKAYLGSCSLTDSIWEPLLPLFSVISMVCSTEDFYTKKKKLYKTPAFLLGVRNFVMC